MEKWHHKVALVVKNLPAKQETGVQSLGWKDPLEEEKMETSSSILAWKIPWTEEPGRLQSIGSHRVGHKWSNLVHACVHTHTQTHTHVCIIWVFTENMYYFYNHRNNIFLFFCTYQVACVIVVPQPGIELSPPAVEVQSLNPLGH